MLPGGWLMPVSCCQFDCSVKQLNSTCVCCFLLLLVDPRLLLSVTNSHGPHHRKIITSTSVLYACEFGIVLNTTCTLEVYSDSVIVGFILSNRFKVLSYHPAGPVNAKTIFLWNSQCHFNFKSVELSIQAMR